MTQQGGGIPWGIIFLVLLLAIAAAAFCWWWGQQRTAAPVTAATSLDAGAPADLISDDRIIFGGIPRASNPALHFTVLHNKAYIVGYSETRKDPLWSAYHVTRMAHPFILERPKGEFLTDTRTLAQVQHRDFTDSGYDRGHMTPNSAIARCFGAEAQRETFLLSNICPQSAPLNRKVWEKLEHDEIEYANQYGDVWMVDGPIFPDVKNPGAHVNYLPTGIAVPEAFYKILLRDDSAGQGTHVEAFAVIMPQNVTGTELPRQFLRSIHDIEDQTGLEFLWKLNPAERAKLENTVARMWPLNP